MTNLQHLLKITISIFLCMKLIYAKQLHSGDEITWNDPDDGLCSRSMIICEIKYKGNGAFSIIDTNGNHLECFACEIS